MIPIPSQEYIDQAVKNHARPIVYEKTDFIDEKTKCLKCKGKRYLVLDCGFGLSEIDCLECVDQSGHSTGFKQ